MAAKIRADDIEAIRKLRDLVGSKDLFPYADYSVNDPDVEIEITLIKKDRDENGNETTLKRYSRDFNESSDYRLPDELRKLIFHELWKVNPDQETIEKLKALDIQILYPDARRGIFR